MLCCGKYAECPWADKVKAILYKGLPGQAGIHVGCRYYDKGRRSCTPALWLWFKLYRICLL